MQVQNLYNRFCDGYSGEHVKRSVVVLRMIVDIDVRNKTPGAAVTSNDGSNAFKGEMMRKLCLRIAVALVSFAGLGITAKAQVVDQVVMTVPFQFVVAGETLPAGTYRVNRLSDDKWEGLILSSFENRAGAMVHPIEVESTHEVESAHEVESTHDRKPHVSFEIAGGEHFLSKIETADNVFTIPVSRKAILLALEKPHSDSSSGSSVGTD
jgi:hypothetical protein